MRARGVLGFVVVAVAITTTRVAGAESIEASLGASIDTGRGLKADEVAVRATTTSFEVRGRKEALAGASAARDQAELDFLPRLTTSARYTRLSAIDQPTVGNITTAPTVGPGPVPPGTALVNVPLAFPLVLDQMAAQAQLSVPVSDYLLRLTQKHRGATEAVEAARWDAEATRLVVATNARIAYYEWVRAKLSVTVAEKALATAEAHVVDAKGTAAAGTATPADVLRAESQSAESERLLVRARSAAADAEDRLRTLMHDDAVDLRAVGEDVRADLPAVDVAGGQERLLAEAAQKRREIKALGHSAAALERQAAATRALYLPRLEAVAEATYANPNSRIFPQREEFRGTWSAGAVLSWSPNDALSAGPSVRAAEAREAETRAQLAAVRDRLRSEVVTSLHALEEAQASLASSRRGVVAAEEGHRVRLALYRAGRATGVELTDAENDLVRARFGLVNAYIDSRLARVRLLHAVGRDA